MSSAVIHPFSHLVTAIYYLLDTNLRMPDESQVFRIIRIMIESAAPPCITAALNVVFDDQAAGGFVFLVGAALLC